MDNAVFPVMVFGAGFGTRMRHLTLNNPKPLVEVGGRALIDHALDLVQSRPAVVNTHYHADQMHTHLASRSNVQISHEFPDILETGGGLKNAMPLLKSNPVMTLNSDAIWAGPNPLDLLAEAWNSSKMDGLLLMVPVVNTVGFARGGDFKIKEDGTLVRDPTGFVYTGAQVVRTDLLHDIAEPAFSLNRLWDVMQEKGRLFGIEYTGKWADVGTPEGVGLAEKLMREHDV